jgi:peptidoglycan/xylan/chitin deacetylase (PgdA/CDA1 family)
MRPARDLGRPRRWAQLCRRGLAALLPRDAYLVRGPADGCVCLTFDDGPHPEHTPRLLGVLREHGVPATFFVVGREAERYPELVRRAAAEGHLIGQHTFSHAEPAQTSAAALLEDVRRADAVLAGILGEPPRLFRPPKGKLTLGKCWRLWRAGRTVVLWNADPKDYACRSEAEVAAWFEAHPPAAGDVVLLHDVWPYAAAALPGVIARARARGLRFATLARWLPRLAVPRLPPPLVARPQE